MYKGTTPTIPITIHGSDLTNAKVFLTFQWGQNGEQITLTTPNDFTLTYNSEDNQMEGNVPLTQVQTLMMDSGDCAAQVRFVFPDGSSGATKKSKLVVNDVLFKDVISYDE